MSEGNVAIWAASQPTQNGVKCPILILQWFKELELE
jgi:hypothetical protein